MEVSQDYINKLVERHKKQLNRVRKYNQDHKEELNLKSREYFKKIKEDPEKYKKYLETKRQKYKEQKAKLVLAVNVFE